MSTSFPAEDDAERLSSAAGAADAVSVDIRVPFSALESWKRPNNPLSGRGGLQSRRERTPTGEPPRELRTIPPETARTAADGRGFIRVWDAGRFALPLAVACPAMLGKRKSDLKK